MRIEATRTWTRLLRALVLAAPWAAPAARGQDLFADPAGVIDFRVDPQGEWRPARDRNALALALTLADEGDEVWFTGEHGALAIGTDNGRKRNSVHKPGGLRGVTVRGVDPSAAFAGFGLAQQQRTKYGGTGLNADLTFTDCTIRAIGQAPIKVFAGTTGYGTLRLERVRFVGDPSVVKWWIRSHGQAAWVLRDCVALGGCIEHFFYGDCLDGDGGRGYALLADGIDVAKCGRTAFQIVDRDESGFRSSGKVLIQNARIRDCGRRDGGSAVTIAGHLGPVELAHLSIESALSREGPEAAPDRGAIALWVDGRKMGANLPPDGFGIGDVLIRAVRVDYEAPDRALVLASGCRSLTIRPPFVLRGGSVGLALEHQRGARMGPVCLEAATPPSSWEGWQNRHPITIGADKNRARRLRLAELDEFYGERSSE
jgi:hypothetical protein